MTSPKTPIRVAIVGVGNCAKSLVEGVSAAHGPLNDGLVTTAFPEVGGYTLKDIQFVLGVDVDARKVGKPLSQAINALPNCAKTLPFDRFPGRPGAAGECDAPVVRGPILDGVAAHMDSNNSRCKDAFVTDQCEYDPSLNCLIKTLKSRKVDVALLYLPVGSARAARWYLEAFLRAGVSFVNCIPEFLVSDPANSGRIRDERVCAIGDDVRSQFGASVLSQIIQETMLERGLKVTRHIQTNQGGNTDFRNMTDRTRLGSKKKSKEAVISSQGSLRGVNPNDCQIHAGPSDYIPSLGDEKVAHLRVEAEGFGGFPVTLDCRLSVQDSPNSAGVVADALRFVKLAADCGQWGPVLAPSALFMKSPPNQMKFADALQLTRQMTKWKPEGVVAVTEEPTINGYRVHGTPA